jgi:hypothetical protein
MFLNIYIHIEYLYSYRYDQDDAHRQSFVHPWRKCRWYDNQFIKIHYVHSKSKQTNLEIIPLKYDHYTQLNLFNYLLKIVKSGQMHNMQIKQFIKMTNE